MSDVIRKRSPNWLPSEKELLLSLVEIHFKIIENKKTDSVTVKKKLVQWQIIADQYNSRTTHCSRTGENLKAQWESMKKVARKDAARRKHLIQAGGRSSIPPKKEDHFQQRIISLLSTSAIGLFNPYDNVSSVPAAVVQDQGKTVEAQTKDFSEAAQIEFIDATMPPTIFNVMGNTSDTDVELEDEKFVTMDWGDYTPQMLRTPVLQPLKNTVPRENPTPHRTLVSRRPTHSNTCSRLDQLHRKKIEAIEHRTKLAVEEMERSKVQHDIDIQIKKEKLKQEKIKTSILLIKRRKLLAFKNRK